MRGFHRPWSTRRGEYASAAALIGVLVVLLFQPVFTSHNTFSTVHELQQRAHR